MAAQLDWEAGGASTARDSQKETQFLCSICSSLPAKLFAAGSSYSHLYAAFHISEWSQKGCRLCVLLLDAVKGEQGSIVFDPRQYERGITLQVSRQAELGRMTALQIRSSGTHLAQYVRLTFCTSRSGQVSDETEKFGEHPYLTSRTSSIRFEHLATNGPDQGEVSSRSCNLKPDDPKVFDLINSWLDICTPDRQGHVNCQTNLVKELMLPARLLEVFPEQEEENLEIKLVVVPGQGESRRPGYVALSHCWGPDSGKILKTTGVCDSFHFFSITPL
jgi:hypothetical protein